jgi:hypothetical protein
MTDASSAIPPEILRDLGKARMEVLDAVAETTVEDVTFGSIFGPELPKAPGCRFATQLEWVRGLPTQPAVLDEPNFRVPRAR